MTEEIAESKYAKLLDFCRTNKIQKHIDKIANKYKDKKILIYGAGLFFQVLKENLDLSKLNIVAVTDRNFSQRGICQDIASVPLNELKSVDFEVVIIATMMPRETELFIRNHNGFKDKKIKIKYFNSTFKKLNPILFNLKKKYAELKKSTASDLIVFYAEKESGESLRYRVLNICEGLKRRGIKTEIVFDHEPDRLEQLKDSMKALIVFRSKNQNFVNYMLPKLKTGNFPIIADIDDYIFSPEDVMFLGEAVDLPPEDIKWHIEQLDGYKKVIQSCDFATATTDFLLTKINDLNIESKVIKNTINESQLALAKKINKKKKKNTSSIIKIGYMSGTKTHNKDFKEVSDAMFEILEKFQNIEFHIVGFLDLEERFEKFQDRIKYEKFMPHLKMLEYLARMDINIAPLELNNPFTAGKSELKIFEAALVKVPSVVSATDAYAKCIKNEYNGFLANSKEDWLKYLSLLIEKSDVRESVANNAYNDFLTQFYIDNNVDTIIDVYNGFIDKYKEKID